MKSSGETRPRARAFGFTFGRLPTGPFNAITDVAGVQVGHCTVVQGEGPLAPGDGPVRTGVTSIIPHGGNVFTDKVTAAVHVINGFGKAAGFVQVAECGVLESPIMLTNTLSVGRVSDALVQYMLQQNDEIGVTTGTVNGVVGECNDGHLNDIRGRHVTEEHVFHALRTARAGEVAEGSVGAGTGMTAFGWKGGIGTSSRVVDVPEAAGAREMPNNYTLGALVLSNFGAARDLTIDGWPVGRFLPEPTTRPDTPAQATTGDGSIVIVLATDAPLDARQLRRVAARAVVGLVRSGSRLSHGSGDYVIAFSTTRRVRHTMAAEAATAAAPLLWPDDGPVMAGLLRAGGEATEEAIVNSLFAARTVEGRDGHRSEALPLHDVERIVRRLQPS